MSILIKGMEMPISCAECPIGGSMRCALIPGVPAWCAEYDQCVKEEKLHSQCPLIPVPPHGRLIDADEFLALCRDYAITPSDSEFCKHLEYALTKAHTIIPAENVT